MTVQQLKGAQPLRPQLVDVRSPAEFAAGHIAGAVNIPLEQLEQRIEDLSSESPVILVCQTGQRARMASDRLGATSLDTRLLEGGTAAWSQACLPLVRTQASQWSLDRQVRLGAGVLITFGMALAWLVSPLWLGLPAVVGAGLTMAGLTDFCPMAIGLAKMPWNRARSGMKQCQGGL